MNAVIHWVLWIVLVLFTAWFIALSGWLAFYVSWQEDELKWWNYLLFLLNIGCGFAVMWFCPFGV